MIRSVKLRPAFYSYYKQDGNSKKKSYELCTNKCESIKDKEIKQNCLLFCEKEYKNDDEEDKLEMSVSGEEEEKEEEKDSGKSVLFWILFSLLWVIIIGLIMYTFVRK